MTLRAVFQRHFTATPDPKMPEHWDIRIKTDEPPFTHLRISHNPAATREGLKVEEDSFTDRKWFSFSGIIDPGQPGNPTDQDAFVEMIERAIPTEIVDDTEKVLRLEFGGEKLKGVLVIDREKGVAIWKPGKPETAEAVRASISMIPIPPLDSKEGEDLVKRLRCALTLKPRWARFANADIKEGHQILIAHQQLSAGHVVEALGGIEFTDRYQALGIPQPDSKTMCKGQCEATGWVPIGCPPSLLPLGSNKAAAIDDDEEPWRSLWIAADAKKPSKDGWHFVPCPDCGGTRFRCGTTMAPEGKTYRVLWMDRRGVQYFDNLEAAQAFAAQPGRDAGDPELVDLPKGARVKHEAPPFQESGMLNEASGRHPHPHEPEGGEHAHWFDGNPPGIVVSGVHDHDEKIWGGHAHQDGDPIEGMHLNVHDGAHDHPLAKGLQDYVEWAASVHYPVHKWLPDHVKTWIKHVRPAPADAEFRLATADDWEAHVALGMHSSGIADPEAHADLFLDEKSRLIEKEYEFEDGARRPATLEDFEAERKWVEENMPPELRSRLIEAFPGVKLAAVGYTRRIIHSAAVLRRCLSGVSVPIKDAPKAGAEYRFKGQNWDVMSRIPLISEGVVLLELLEKTSG